MTTSLQKIAEGAGPVVVVFRPAAEPGPFDLGPDPAQGRDVTIYGCSVPADLPGDGPFAVVGWSDGGRTALAFAAARPELVTRLAVVATPLLPEPAGFRPDQVTAKTLLLYGAKDPVAGPRHGKWWKQRIPDSRYEQIPGDGPLAVTTVWRRVLSHLAPGRLR